MYKIKRFSKSRIDEDNKDADLMVSSGKVGLKAAGVTGGLAGIELGRGAVDAYKVSKDVSELKKLKDNKVIRDSVKNLIHEKAPTKKIAEEAIEKIKWAEKNAPKFNKIEKVEKGLKWWNKGSKMSRTVLDNADKYSEMLVDHIKSKGNHSEEELRVLNKLPKSVKRAAKASTHLKNAKTIGKGALIASQAGGLLYLNGRALQNNSDPAKRNLKGM